MVFVLRLRYAVLAMLLGVGATAGAATAGPSDAQVEARAHALLVQLTTEEKVALMAGGSGFGTAPIARLGIPALSLSDGPNGVRSNDEVAATVFSTGSALAATWNPQLAQAEGAAIGREARALGVAVMLGPNVNIQRSRWAGVTSRCIPKTRCWQAQWARRSCAAFRLRAWVLRSSISSPTSRS